MDDLEKNDLIEEPEPEPVPEPEPEPAPAPEAKKDGRKKPRSAKQEAAFRAMTDKRKVLNTVRSRNT